MSTRLKNLFYRVAKDENSITEIFCNMMNLKLFREKFLDLFLPAELINEVSFENFETQVGLNEGQPDIIIENERIKVNIEIKTSKYTKLTNNQPEGYLNDLLNSNNDKWIVFILPEGYIYEKNIEDKYKFFDDKHPSNGIEKKIIFWENIIESIESSELNKINQIVDEFYRLLRIWYTPERITFNYQEIKTMHSNEIPDILTKLGKIVDEIYSKAASYEPYSYNQKKFPPNEYGVYFRRTDEKDKKHDILFFGIWLSFWKEKKLPICFGVQEKYPEYVKLAFEKQFQEKIIQYEDWKLSWIDESVFSHDDCIDKIWDILENFLSKIN